MITNRDFYGLLATVSSWPTQKFCENCREDFSKTVIQIHFKFSGLIYHTNMHTMSWGFTIPICIQCHGDLPYQYAYNVMGIYHTNMHTMSWGFTIPICIQCHGDVPYQYAYNVMGIYHINMHTMPWGFTIPICIQCHGDLPYQYAYNVMGIYHTNMHTMSWGFGNIPNHCFPEISYNEQPNLQ